MEHQYLTGTYSRDASALTELLKRYLSADFDEPENLSIDTYNKQIHKITSKYIPTFHSPRI